VLSIIGPHAPEIAWLYLESSHAHNVK
jgi:hypothetical protein